MSNPDPRYATFPTEVGLPQLHWLIHQAEAGTLTIDEFVRVFRNTHEAIERAGRPQYKSKEEARLIWDVLWTLEFYSPNPAGEANPREWNDAASVLAEVRRVAQRLMEL